MTVKSKTFPCVGIIHLVQTISIVMFCLLTSSRMYGDEVRSTVTGGSLLKSGTFNGSIILARPTTTTMTADICAQKESRVYIAYGLSPDTLSQRTEEALSSPSKPAFLVMKNLYAGRRYYYAVCFAYSDTPADTGASAGVYNCTQTYHFEMPKTAGMPFNFTVQSDSHLLNKADRDLYTQNMNNIASLNPDFVFDLGDAFLIDNGGTDVTSLTQKKVDDVFTEQLPYFSIAARNAPIFLTIGNHESEYGALLDGTKTNPAAMSTIARLTYYANPEPNDYYSGNREKEALFGSPEDYYAFTWGDALFVSIDPYRYSLNGATGDNKGDGWGWTLGKTQYDWFRKTLETSRAKYKFVFAHHAIGNMRGGAEIAKLYEWGGNDQRGNYLFDQKRPGWGKPIQQIMKDTGVTIFFQGHDHLFAREVVDDVVYQTIPKPAEKVADHQNNFKSFTGDVLLNSGFLNVSVSPDTVRVDYNRNYLVASGAQTTGVVYSYTVDANHRLTILAAVKDDLSQYGLNDAAKNSGGDKTSKQKTDTPGTKKTGGKKQSTKSAAEAKSATDGITAVGAVSASSPAPVPAGGFVFAVEADPHFDDNTDTALLSQTASNIISAKPSFLIDLGDTTMIEKLAKTSAEIKERTDIVSRYFAQFAPISVHQVTGNHDVYISSGEGNYYSFTQGNALFIVLDPYAYSSQSAGRDGGWAPTLGRTQYDWLKTTLASSTAPFKFVFIHNIVSGIDKDCRGGAETASYYEWGGLGSDDKNEFSLMRPGWDMPIHDLLVKYGVTIVFHGHDHFYAEQQKDGIVYQLVPQPGTPGNSVNDAADFGYKQGVFLPSAGYMRVVVGSDKAVVEYIQTQSGGGTAIPNVYTVYPASLGVH